jgi:RNA recognition motif-containing protein
MSRRILVHNLDELASADDVYALFRWCGRVVDISMPTRSLHVLTPQERIASVTFHSSAGAQAARTLSGAILGTSVVYVTPAVDNPTR